MLLGCCLNYTAHTELCVQSTGLTPTSHARSSTSARPHAAFRHFVISALELRTKWMAVIARIAAVFMAVFVLQTLVQVRRLLVPMCCCHARFRSFHPRVLKYVQFGSMAFCSTAAPTRTRVSWRASGKCAAPDATLTAWCRAPRMHSPPLRCSDHGPRS